MSACVEQRLPCKKLIREIPLFDVSDVFVVYSMTELGHSDHRN
jgi:hypothetical protein